MRDFIAWFCKNHSPSLGLENAGDRHWKILTNALPAIIDHHHCSVIKVSHALLLLFAFLQNPDLQHFSGYHNGLKRVGKFINIEHANALEFSHFI